VTARNYGRAFGGCGVVGFLSVSACSTDPDSLPIARIDAPCELQAPDGYFGAEFARGRQSRTSAGIFHQSLRALAEPSLACGGERDEAYRFSETSPLQPVAMVVRVTRVGSTYELIALRPGPQEDGGYSVQRIQRTLTRDEWDAIASIAARIDTSAGKPFPPPPPSHATWTDSSAWLFEFRLEGTYRLLGGADVDAEPRLGALREVLLKSAGFGS
jgi:hypothetical protein